MKITQACKASATPSLWKIVKCFFTLYTIYPTEKTLIHNFKHGPWIWLVRDIYVSCKNSKTKKWNKLSNLKNIMCFLLTYYNLSIMVEIKIYIPTHKLASFLSKLIKQHHRVFIWWCWQLSALHLCMLPAGVNISASSSKPMMDFWHFSSICSHDILLKPGMRFCNNKKIKKNSMDYTKG